MFLTLILYMGPILSTSLSMPEHIQRVVEATRVLNAEWYNCSTGLWDDVWMSSANTLTTIANLGSLNLTESKELNIAGYVRHSCDLLQQRGLKGHFVTSYQDEGYWALALIQVYDFLGEQSYLDAAIELFDDMSEGITGSGGLVFSKSDKSIDALVNELYMSVAASLANRVPQNTSYSTSAQIHWSWFQNSGLMNNDSIIKNQIDATFDHDSSKGDRQGVILGALAELAEATGQIKYLQIATDIAISGIRTLSTTADQTGVLKVNAVCELENTCPGSQHRNGIFIRNLSFLYRKLPHVSFQQFISSNAASLWINGRDDKNKLGAAWNGPYTGATAATQSSALDALVAALVVA